MVLLGSMITWHGLGVATLDYAAVAVTGGRLHAALGDRIVRTALAALALSVVLHRLTAMPVNRAR